MTAAAPAPGRVAELLSARTRREDALVARLGGDAFAVVLPGTPREAARELADVDVLLHRAEAGGRGRAHTPGPDPGAPAAAGAGITR